MAKEPAGILTQARNKTSRRVRRGLDAEDFGGLRKINKSTLESEQPVYACPCRCWTTNSLGTLYLTEEFLYYGSYTDQKPAIEMPLPELLRDPLYKRERFMFGSLYVTAPSGEYKFDLIRPSDASTLRKAIVYLMHNPPRVRRFSVGSGPGESVTLRVSPGERNVAWHFDTPQARQFMARSQEARDSFLREYNAFALQLGMPQLDHWSFATAVSPTFLLPIFTEPDNKHPIEEPRARPVTG